jgi:hypothetical protein
MNNSTDATLPGVFPFESGGKSYFIRKPLTEEYDDARMLLEVVQKRTRVDPLVKDLEKYPCSEDEADGFRALIEASRVLMDRLSPDDYRRVFLRKRIQAAEESLKKWTLADEVASDRASLARDRYLCRILLCDENGDPVVSTDTEWEDLPLKVKDASRQTIWRALQAVKDGPFGSEEDTSIK